MSLPTDRPSAYRLQTAWWVQGNARQIARVMMEPSSYADWWRRTFLTSRLVEAGDHHHVGSKIHLRVKGFLPHTLSFLLEIGEAHPERGFVASAHGDFEGTARCEVTSRGVDDHVVRFDWNIEVRKPFVRGLSPILRRLFVLNHFWNMRHGRRCLQLEVLRSRGVEVPAPPGPLFPHNFALVRSLYRRQWTAR